MSLETIFVKYIKLRNKLSKAKIYKIVDNTNQNVYIGSTCRTLKERLSSHKGSYKSFLKEVCNNMKSFDIIKNNDYQIELLENCNIKTKQELLTRERFFIENNDCLNKIVPGRTDKEYREANKDKKKEYLKEYYFDNKEKINIKRNQKIDCECGGKYARQHKARHFKSQKHQEFVKANN